MGFLTRLCCFVAQALKDSTEVEVVDKKIRKKENPEKWPLPETDFTRLLNCPEFIPGQTYKKQTGKVKITLTVTS